MKKDDLGNIRLSETGTGKILMAQSLVRCVHCNSLMVVGKSKYCDPIRGWCHRCGGPFCGRKCMSKCPCREMGA